MRRVLIVIAVMILALAAVLAVNAARFRAAPQPKLPPVAVRDDPAAVARLAEVIRIPTVSRENVPADAAAFAVLHGKLEADFPRVHAALRRESVAGQSLIFTWPGSDPSLPPLLLTAHQDVVPVEAGSEGRWTHPPFAGIVADGMIWGRGSLDDKAMVMSVLEAAERKLAAGWRPKRTVIFAFGHDEESGGTGAAAMAALLQSRGIHPFLVLDEGLAVLNGIFPGVAQPVAAIGTAEKGYVTVELTAKGTGGHSSTPSADNAIVRLAKAVERLDAHPFPDRLGPPLSDTFARVGPHMGTGARVAFANLWLTKPLILRQLGASPGTGASIRTTTAATMLSAGTKENVLPQFARAIVNHRILPGDTVAGVVAHDRAAVDDPKVTVRAIGTQREPTRVSPADGPAFAAVERAVVRAFPDAIVAPSLTVGGTDARHYEPVSGAIFRFSPMTLGPRDLERIHGTDERIPVADYLRAIAFYEALLDEGAGK